LIGAFTDLPSHVRKRNLFAEMAESFLPGTRMEINGIDERSIDIEDDGFDHRIRPAQGLCHRRAVHILQEFCGPAHWAS
jgi:hypothetical protein